MTCTHVVRKRQYIMIFTRNQRQRSKYLWFIFFVILCLFIVNNIYKFSIHNKLKSLNCSQLCPYSSTIINRTIHFDSSHIIRHFPNFVCPQNFRNLADWVYGWPEQFNEHLDVITDQGKYFAPCLPSGSIIYVRIESIDEFFDDVYPHLQNDFILITGEGDLSSPIRLKLLDAPDSKIIHWFGQNGQYDVSTTKKFTHIPIGINCFEMADSIQTVYSQQPNQTLPPVFNDLDEPSSYIQPQDISHRVLMTNISNKDLVLINFTPSNDPTGHRLRVWNKMCAQKSKQHYTYATCLKKPSGVQIEKLPQIYKRNRQYPFWLSPRGGGLDCHRTWEALYLDIIPIVWNSSLNVLYENLPVLIINDLKDLNEKFLYEKLYEISKKKISKEKVYQYEKLRHAYWRRLILNKSRHREKNDIYQRTNQCWRSGRAMNKKRSSFFFWSKNH